MIASQSSPSRASSSLDLNRPPQSASKHPASLQIIRAYAALHTPPPLIHEPARRYPTATARPRQSLALRALLKSP